MKCDYCENEITTGKVRKSTGGNFDIVTDTIAMPFTCRRCGGSFCAKHRLPENHNCVGLKPPVVVDFTDIEQEMTDLGTWDRQRDWKERDEGTGIYGKRTNEAQSSGVPILPELKNLKVMPSKSNWIKQQTKKIFKSILIFLFSVFLLFLLQYVVIFADQNDILENFKKPDLVMPETGILNTTEFLDINKTSHYAESDEYIYAGGNGHEIYLQNNLDAVDPTYDEVVNFIKIDKTDLMQYSEYFVCADYAEIVHNNAEANGIKTAWVAISFYDDDNGHALNGFNTLDKGFIYIDSTGGTEIGPCSYDRLIGIEIGKPMWYYELYKCDDDYYYPPFISSKVESIDVIW